MCVCVCVCVCVWWGVGARVQAPTSIVDSATETFLYFLGTTN